MTETLGDLLRRSAAAAPEPRLDVSELVTRAGSRVRRRRLAVASTAVGLVTAVVVGVFAVRGGQPRELEPAPSPAPSPPGSVAVDPDGTRPLVYAEGSTVHIDGETFDAGGTVRFLDVTDDGVVYVADDGDQPQLWFRDDTTTRAIGRVDRWPGNYLFLPGRVHTAPSGSLVVWEDPTSRGKNEIPGELVVYDTSRRDVVARIPRVGNDGVVLHVDDSQVYFNPAPDTPGCWVVDVQDLHPCADPQLFRYDVATGQTTKIRRSALNAELRTEVRMFTAVAQDGHVELTESPQFAQVDRQLVASVHYSVVDSDATHVARTNGDAIRLRLPEGYHVPGDVPDVNGVSYWLDDDHVVVAAGDSGGDIGPVNGDVLVCRLPDGVCLVAQRDVTLVAPR
jgi:hypothetical protein